MKKLVLVLCCSFFFINSTMSQDISDFKWKNRVLLLVADNLNHKNLNKQLEVFKQTTNAFKERDVILFMITPKSSYNSDKTPVNLEGIDTYQKNNFEGVILLGKDGGIKLKKPFVVPTKSILDLIDSMPMRRGEIKSQQ